VEIFQQENFVIDKTNIHRNFIDAFMKGEKYLIHISEWIKLDNIIVNKT
jgi:hypothetical protein